jgi:hypothetical protein
MSYKKARKPSNQASLEKQGYFALLCLSFCFFLVDSCDTSTVVFLFDSWDDESVPGLFLCQR